MDAVESIIGKVNSTVLSQNICINTGVHIFESITAPPKRGLGIYKVSEVTTSGRPRPVYVNTLQWMGIVTYSLRRWQYRYIRHAKCAIAYIIIRPASKKIAAKYYTRLIAFKIAVTHRGSESTAVAQYHYAIYGILYNTAASANESTSMPPPDLTNIPAHMVSQPFKVSPNKVKLSPLSITICALSPNTISQFWKLKLLSPLSYAGCYVYFGIGEDSCC